MSGTNATSASQEENVLKRKSDDVGWEYWSLADASNMDKVKCMFCNHVSTGGVYRHKQHVAHVGNAVVKCKKTSQEAKDRCRKSLEEAPNKRREKAAREQELRQSVNISRIGDDEATCMASVEPQKLGPIDKWARPIDPKLTHAEALHQQKINNELSKKRTHEVRQYVARWVYNHGN
ncbi:hypothetical protein ZWY2020_006571 [Hordeum vulgare]|nr:hypothetical protein ZWY2020_006571 [Hordeum vulgare]